MHRNQNQRLLPEPPPRGAAGAPPLPKREPWPRDRDPLLILGDFERYTEVEPRVERREQLPGSIFADHSVLQFDDFDGAGHDSPHGLTIHRFTVSDGGASMGPVRAPGEFDAALSRAALALRNQDPSGALRSNQGGYHSAASLRGRAEDPSHPCWGELHSILDAAAAAALEVEADEGRVPRRPTDGGEPLQVTDSWVNVNRGRGDFNKLHMHLPAVYSGVYYAQPPNDSLGRLNGAFVLPLTASSTEIEDTAGDASTGKRASEITYALMRAQRGVVLLFPASMLHAVLPSYSAECSETDENRISIGFNVSPFW